MMSKDIINPSRSCLTSSNAAAGVATGGPGRDVGGSCAEDANNLCKKKKVSVAAPGALFTEVPIREILRTSPVRDSRKFTPCVVNLATKAATHGRVGVAEEIGRAHV